MGWCEDNPNTFCNIGERDVDFVLLEELRCSGQFRKRFLAEALSGMGVTACPDSGSVFHSVHRTGESTGETDLLVEFMSASPAGVGVHAVLIEDKIDAQFSDRTRCGSKQTERYRAEITKNIALGRWTAAVTLLIAPEAYIQAVDTSAFDSTVSYEDVVGWLVDEAWNDSSLRFEHKRQMLQAAISRWKRGWNRKPDEKVRGIWGHYYAIASTEFPDVCMNYKGGEPPDSYTVSFACLPHIMGLPKCRIDHVMERGTVDILVPGGSEQFTSISSRIVSTLKPNMSLRRAGKSLGVNVKVRQISRFGDVHSQSGVIREALATVRSLKEWFDLNSALLRL